MKHRNTLYILISVFALLISSLACNAVTGGVPDLDAPGPVSVVTDEPSQPPGNDGGVEVTEPPQEQPDFETINQWAIAALASSEYDNPDWSAMQATGEPDALECGDFPETWASAESNGVDWLELTYEIPVYPEQINIYQNNLPDQVTKVEVIDTTYVYHTVYTGEPSVTDCPYTLTVNVSDVDFLVMGVRVTIDQSILDASWDEIDAVELVGYYDPSGTVAIPEVEPSDDIQPSAGDFELPDMSPFSLDPGTFYYVVEGAGEDKTVDTGTLQDQSIDVEYVLGFVSGDFRYAVSLFIPRDVSTGLLPLQPYSDGSVFSRSPSAAIFIGSGFYYADGGMIMIDAIDGDTVSGSFVFVGTNEYDSARVVTVSGVFNDIPLVNK